MKGGAATRRSQRLWPPQQRGRQTRKTSSPRALATYRSRDVRRHQNIFFELRPVPARRLINAPPGRYSEVFGDKAEGAQHINVVVRPVRCLFRSTPCSRSRPITRAQLRAPRRRVGQCQVYSCLLAPRRHGQRPSRVTLASDARHVCARLVRESKCETNKMPAWRVMCGARD